MPSSGSRRRRNQSNGASNQFTTAPYAALAVRVRDDHAEVAEKRNTTIAYSRPKKEFKLMCDYQYPLLSEASRYLVDEPKTFVFLYYTAYRPQKKRGRAKRGEQKIHFDQESFSRLVNGLDLNQAAESESHSASISQQEPERDSESAKKLCQHDVINQAYNALLELLSEQHEENTNLTTEVQITGSRRITFLRDVVRRRKNSSSFFKCFRVKQMVTTFFLGECCITRRLKAAPKGLWLCTCLEDLS
jgi:hypothetical protein